MDIEQRLALRLEVGRLGIARRGFDRWTPEREQVSHPRLMIGVALRRRIGNPEIELKRPSASRRLAPSPISRGVINSAPQAPRPPAFMTAIDSAGALAPAMGARRIGVFSPNRWQNLLMRSPMAMARY